jgi:hypothetical protein
VRVQDLARIEPHQVGRVLDHLGAQRLEHLGGVFDGDGHVAVDLLLFHESEVRRVGDREMLHALVQALEVVLLVVRPPVGIARVGPGHHIHHHGGIEHGAGHRPDV